jgi:hypothetical protein
MFHYYIYVRSHIIHKHYHRSKNYEHWYSRFHFAAQFIIGTIMSSCWYRVSGCLFSLQAQKIHKEKLGIYWNVSWFACTAVSINFFHINSNWNMFCLVFIANLLQPDCSRNFAHSVFVRSLAIWWAQKVSLNFITTQRIIRTNVWVD